MTEFSAPTFANAVARALGRPYALRPDQVVADGSLADLMWMWGGVEPQDRATPNPQVGEWRPLYELAGERRQQIELELSLGGVGLQLSGWIEHRAHHGWVGLRHTDTCCGGFWLSFEPDGGIKTDNLWRASERPLKFEAEEVAFLHRLNKELRGAIAATLRERRCMTTEEEGMKTLLGALEGK